MFFWLGGLLCLGLFVWVFSDIILPFALGIAAAYLLNPVVNKMDDFGIPRWRVALWIVVLFYFFILTCAAFMVPVIMQEISVLIERTPYYLHKMEEFLEPYIERFYSVVGDRAAATDVKEIAQNTIPALAAGKTILGGLKAGGAAIVSFITVLVITPIVTYFMIKEWPQFTRWMEDLIPCDHRETVLKLARGIDGKVAGFMRGQILVVSVLAVIYAICLSLAGLESGFIIGLAAGILNIIPMVGSTVGLIVGVAVAWFQTGGDWGFVGLIAGIFLIGQIIEGNVLTPKLLGDSVGLHPLWIFFALMAGSALMGITGMLLAIPVTASIGVLLGFAIEKYRESSYYKGCKA